MVSSLGGHENHKQKQRGSKSELSDLLCVDGKTPKMLWPALRQYQHNDCSGLLVGFDYNEIMKILADEITKAHIAGQADAGVDPGYSNAQGYLWSLANT